jgi:hypothetical protein
MSYVLTTYFRILRCMASNDKSWLITANGANESGSVRCIFQEKIPSIVQRIWGKLRENSASRFAIENLSWVILIWSNLIWYIRLKFSCITTYFCRGIGIRILVTSRRNHHDRKRQATECGVVGFIWSWIVDIPWATGLPNRHTRIYSC